MKNIITLIVGIVMMTVVSLSCKKSGVTSDFDKSYNAWTSFKSSSNNSYSYLVTHDASAGFYTETTITVNNGTVVKRDYFQYAYTFTPGSDGVKKVLDKEWHETSVDLGLHGVEGADLFTLDDIYAEAKNLWIGADPEKYNVTFETNNNGMISAAGYASKKCKADCFIGINIKSITK